MKKMSMLVMVLIMALGFCLPASAEAARTRRTFVGSPAAPLHVVLPVMTNIQVSGDPGIVFWRTNFFTGAKSIFDISTGGLVFAGTYDIQFPFENASIDIVGDVDLDATPFVAEMSKFDVMTDFLPQKKLNDERFELWMGKFLVGDCAVYYVHSNGFMQISDSFVVHEFKTWGWKEVLIFPINKQGFIDLKFFSKGNKGFDATEAWVLVRR